MISNRRMLEWAFSIESAGDRFMTAFAHDWKKLLPLYSNSRAGMMAWLNEDLDKLAFLRLTAKVFPSNDCAELAWIRNPDPYSISPYMNEWLKNADSGDIKWLVKDCVIRELDRKHG